MRIIEALNRNIAGCIGAADLGGGAYRVDFVGSSRNATAPEITAAQATVDADAAATAQIATLRTQAINAISRLQEIQNAASPTNAQVVQAVRDMALYLEKLIRVVGNTVT